MASLLWPDGYYYCCRCFLKEKTHIPPIHQRKLTRILENGLKREKKVCASKIPLARFWLKNCLRPYTCLETPLTKSHEAFL
jgi:hypothetical protein